MTLCNSINLHFGQAAILIGSQRDSLPAVAHCLAESFFRGATVEQIPDSRTCEQCSAPLTRRPSEGADAWAIRLYCSHACYVETLRANAVPCELCPQCGGPVKDRRARFCKRACQKEFARSPKAIAPRFWAKVNRDGPIPVHCPELGPCYVWTAGTDGHDYGQFNLEHGKPVKAHRVAWFLEFGSWPNPCALHRCDNPPCVRVSHLFEGTHQDNMADMAAKGRYNMPELKGSAHPNSKLVEADVISMRTRHAAGETIVSLARSFVMSRDSVSKIVNRKAWQHV